MPIGIMGRKSLALMDGGSRFFTNMKREGINTFACAVYLYVAENPTLPIMPFGIVAYGFVGQPFSKQL